MIFLWFMNGYDINYRTSAGIPLTITSPAVWASFLLLHSWCQGQNWVFLYDTEFGREKPPVSLCASHEAIIYHSHKGKWTLSYRSDPTAWIKADKMLYETRPLTCHLCPSFPKFHSWMNLNVTVSIGPDWQQALRISKKRGSWPATLSAKDPLGFWNTPSWTTPITRHLGKQLVEGFTMTWFWNIINWRMKI